MLSKSPLTGVEIPKKEKRKANVLEPEEALKVLEVCRTEPGGIFAAFLLWAGTANRGLQWKDVNWEKGSVRSAGTSCGLNKGRSGNSTT